MHAVVTA